MANKKGVIVYYDIIEQLEDFSDEQVGQMFRAIINYDKEGIIPNFTGEMKVAFKFIKLTIDRNKEEYNAKCEKNRQIIQEYWDKKKCTNEYERIRTNTNATDKDIDKDIDNKEIYKESPSFSNSENVSTSEEINSIDANKLNSETRANSFIANEVVGYLDLVGSKQTNSDNKLSSQAKKKELEDYIQSLFDKIWVTYPKKASKEQARKTWFKKLKKFKTEEEVLEKAQKIAKMFIQAKTSWVNENRDKQYIPHFSSWLNSNIPD